MLGHVKQSTTLDYYSLVIYDDENLIQTNNLISDLVPKKDNGLQTDNKRPIDFRKSVTKTHTTTFY